MPGIVVFRRRWSVGSDDLVVPGVFLFTVHFIWILVLTASLLIFEWQREENSVFLLWQYIIAYLGVLILSLLFEFVICLVAMRGSILDTARRSSMQYLLYIRLTIMFLELLLLIAGVVWIVYYYRDCPMENAKDVLLGLVICNWCILVSILMTVWCTYDAAGRSWVKMKQYQRSLRQSESRFQYKRSGSSNRNWRQRKVIRAYQDSWDHRCRLLFCCMTSSDRNRNSFADIAKLLSDFFRDLDVVPSDVVAGLVLLRKFQKIEQEAIVKEGKNDTYEFLSGVAVTPRTQFLKLNDPQDLDLFQSVIYYMHYALGAYGWPVFLMTRSATGLCQLCTKIQCSCSCFPCFGVDEPSAPTATASTKGTAIVVEDNCCQCNYAALQKMVEIGDVEIIYATFHVDVGETPFFVAVDYAQRKIVISIRGTLSMKDVITDLNAEGEVLPVTPLREDWLGHKGMVQAAEYIRDKIIGEDILQQARQRDPARGTLEYSLVLVGHSLGAGTASILAILLRQAYPDLRCYSFSPPGGLLSMPAVQYSKEFTISVVVGKDVVPRIGLYQMESLRADLINAIQRSVDPKWKTIMCSVVCCGCAPMPTSAINLRSGGDRIDAYQLAKDAARSNAVHPSDSSIALTLHHPLYPPGRIIHIVRHHPSNSEQALTKKEPVYQAVWVENTDFDEVLISPVMIQDHMPDKVLEALNKVITTFGPRKPQRQSSTSAPCPADPEKCELLVGSSPKPVPQRLYLETSFTSLQSPTVDANLFQPSSSVNSSISGNSNFYPAKLSPIQLSSILYPENNSTSFWQHGNNNHRSIISPGQITSPQSWHPTNILPESEFSARKNSAPDHEIFYPNVICAKNNNINNNSSNNNKNNFKNSNRKPISFSLSHMTDSSRNLKKLTRPKICSLDLEQRNRVDLIHDDWFGLAPLASPESLSEVSSISSRASGLEKTNLTEVISTSYELRTPKLMRRTPKITGNLSTCADDIENVKYFQKITQNSTFVVPHHLDMPDYSHTNSSGDLSFESAKNEIIDPTKFQHLIDIGFINTSTETDSFQSAENILDANGSCKIPSEMNLCYSGCPNCPCKYQSEKLSQLGNGNYQSMRNICCQNYDHTDCVFDPYEKSFSTSTEINLSSKSTPEIRLNNPKYMETHFDQSFDFKSTNLQVPVSYRKLPSPKSTPQILSPTSPEIDPDLISNFAIDLNLDPENRSTYRVGTIPKSVPEPVKSSPSVDSGSICKTPSEPCKSVSFSPQIISLDPSMIQSDQFPFSSRHNAEDLKSIIKETTQDFPTYETKKSRSFLESLEKFTTRKSDRWFLLPKRSPRKTKVIGVDEFQKVEDLVSTPVLASSSSRPPAVISTKRQTHVDEQCFSKNESLPLLSGLNSNAEKTSPGYVRRKKYIYPINKIGRNESSV